MATKLKNITITKVALCPEGACSEAFINLFKTREGGTEMNFEEILKQLEPEAAQIIKDELAKAQQEVPAETATELTKTKEDLAKAKEDLATAETELSKAKTNAEDDEEALLKSLDPAVRKLFEKQKIAAQAAQDQINKMKEQEETSLAKARAAEVEGVGADKATLETMFKSLHGMDPKVCEQVHEVLKTAQAVIAKGDLFKAAGSAGEEGNDDAYAKIEAKAQEIAKARNITVAKAVSVVMEENPEMYEAYIKQQMGE